MMAFRQQQILKASQAFSLTQLICIGALLVVATTLHGCGSEKCPAPGPGGERPVPIAFGKVFFTCAGTTCTFVKAVCEPGYGHGFKSTSDGEMQFLINQVDECVIKFTKEPVACHKCDEGGVLCKGEGTDEDPVMVSSFGPTDPADAGKDTNEGEGKPVADEVPSEAPEGTAAGSGNAATAEEEAAKAEPPVGIATGNATKASSLLDIQSMGLHDHGSKSVQIASADVDAKQKVTVSLLDVDVHYDVSKPEPEATSIRRAGRKGFSHQKSLSSWAQH